MGAAIDHDELNELLRRCGAAWDAARVHGLLSARVAVTGIDGGTECLEVVLEGTDVAHADRSRCERALIDLFRETHLRLADRQSEFALLLPDDEVATDVRAAALARWCEGYLQGLVTASAAESMRQRLASDPIAGIIKDMLQITRASTGDDGDVEGDEAAYAELVEYLRVAAQLVYEELAESRRVAAELRATGPQEPGALH